MRLRIYRTWSWVLNCSPFEVRYGGENPMKLVSSDTLQYLDGDKWKDIEVVEEEKPEHPKTKRDREHNERIAKQWEETFKRLEPDLAKLPDLAELIRKS